MLDHVVKQVAMNDPEPQTIGCLVNIFRLDRYVTKVDAKILPGSLIMVARNVDNLCALACFSKQLLNHIVMFLWPVESFLQLPAINNITDEIKLVAVGMFQKMQERLRPRPWRPQVNVGDPNGAVCERLCAFVKQKDCPEKCRNLALEMSHEDCMVISFLFHFCEIARRRDRRKGTIVQVR